LVPERQYEEAVRTVTAARGSVADKLFGTADYLVCPTTAIEQPRVVDCRLSSRTELRALRNTRPFNVLGIPAISVPAGFTADRLPIGLQICGRPGDDWGVLNLALAYEQETSWHLRRPPLEE
jgi:aspartyl-tRNA(Asn)/glutamyl-tRNA(Gln) amidotransferase subunit A